MSDVGRHLRIVLPVALCVVAAFVVVTLRARGWAVVPDLVLLPVIAVALTRGSAVGALSGIAAGWVVDLVPPGGAPLGLTALLYAAAGALAGRGTRLGPLPTRWVALVSLGAALVPAAGRLLHGAWLGQQVSPVQALTEVAVTAVVAVVVVPPLVRLDKGDESW